MFDKNGILLSNAALEAEQEVNAAIDFLQGKIPDMISFGIRVVLCFVA